MKKQNLTPFNNKVQYHGFWITYKFNGDLSYKGQYVNGKEYGYWIDYDSGFNIPRINFYLR